MFVVDNSTSLVPVLQRDLIDRRTTATERAFAIGGEGRPNIYKPASGRKPPGDFCESQAHPTATNGPAAGLRPTIMSASEYAIVKGKSRGLQSVTLRVISKKVTVNIYCC